MAKAKNGTDNAITEWKDGSELAKAGFKRLGNPEILRLREMPVGAVIDCTPTAVKQSQKEGIRQPLIEATLTEDGRKITIPAQASIANQLLNKEQTKLMFPGKRVLIKKSGMKVSSKWKDENGNGRQFATYEIAVQE